MVQNVKPKVGLMAVGLYNYWAQFPGMKDHLECTHQELISKISNIAEPIQAGFVDTPEASVDAGKLFQKEDVDIVFCHSMTYASSDTIVPAIKDLKVPVIVLNIQECAKLDLKQISKLDDWLGHGCTCAGLPELTAMLERYGISFDVITGCLSGDKTVDAELNKWCAAAAVRRKIKGGNIGLLGRQFQGMMDLYVDENAIMKSFGMMTKFLMWEEVLELESKVTDKEISDARTVLETAFDFKSEVAAADIDNIVRMYAGYNALAKKYNLNILANHFERDTVGREVDMIAALNPSTVALMKQGVACAVEGDIKGGIAMFILKAIGGNANLAELYSMDFDDDICLVGHSGGADPDISDEKIQLKIAKVFHGKAGKGYTTQAVVREGPITLFALKMDCDGKFKFICSEGQCEKGDVLQFGDTNCRVRANKISMREFVNKWSMEGPSHHGVMGTGHHKDALKAVAKIFNIPFVSIDES